ncbi:MAG: 30S ribosomal protein S11 [Parcubacteria group bacterium]|jgi:small subunit ribosomal protein S11
MAEEIKKVEEKSEKAVENTEPLEVSEGKKETAPEKKKKKIKKQIQKGQAHIQCSYNNTLITITDMNGEVLAWSSSGLLGFKGAKKSTPFASTQVAGDVSEKMKKYGTGELNVFVKGVGSGREAAIRALANRGFNLVSIKDITPVPHNGCRPRKPRRV